MKLKKFNENFQNINPFDEYKVILTDEFYDLDFQYPTFKEVNNDGIIFSDISETKYDYLGIKITFDPLIDKELLFKKIHEMNSHLIVEDINFIGFYNLLFNKLIEIDPNDKPSFIKNCVYLLYKTDLNLCVNCKYRCVEEEGYSNYTIDGTYNHCLKNVWTPIDQAEIPQNEKGITCQYYKKNINDRVIINIEVEDSLEDHLYGSMDIDLVEAFKKYNNFIDHSWED